MAIELPAKKYYTFPELAARLQCSEQDLRHLVIEGEITPSLYLDYGDYCDYQINSDEDQDGLHLFPSEVFDWQTTSDDLGVRTHLGGFHFLIFRSRKSAIDCEFNYFSKISHGHDVGEICFLLEHSVNMQEVLQDGVVMADELARFETLHDKSTVSMQFEKPLGTNERNTLLTIIAALAKEAKINIAQPGKAALCIEDLTDKLGAHVSKRAIEDHLKKIPDALETRMK